MRKSGKLAESAGDFRTLFKVFLGKTILQAAIVWCLSNFWDSLPTIVREIMIGNLRYHRLRATLLDCHSIIVKAKQKSDLLICA